MVCSKLCINEWFACDSDGGLTKDKFGSVIQYRHHPGSGLHNVRGRQSLCNRIICSREAFGINELSDKGPRVKAECLPTIGCSASSNNNVGVRVWIGIGIGPEQELFTCGRNDE